VTFCLSREKSRSFYESGKSPKLATSLVSHNNEIVQVVYVQKTLQCKI